MTNDQIVQELEYLISRGVPPEVEGVLKALMASLHIGTVQEMHGALIPFIHKMTMGIESRSAKLN